ncbi:transposase, partial [Microbacterium lacticum]
MCTQLTVGVCRVHFMRNVLSNVPKASGPMVASIIRTIFAQPDTE